MNSISNSRSSSSAPIAAQSVVYNNTTSGLQATNVQDAIDEVAQGGSGGVGAWTLLGTQNGNTPISEPADYTEVMIKVNPDDSSCIMTMFLPKISISSGEKYRTGFFISGVFGAEATVSYTSGDFALDGVHLNGSDKLSASTISIYYR